MKLLDSKGQRGGLRGDRTSPPAPAELAAALAGIRAAEFARLAAQVPLKSQADRRRLRMAQLPPLLREAVMAATGDGAESWQEED